MSEECVETTPSGLSLSNVSINGSIILISCTNDLAKILEDGDTFNRIRTHMENVSKGIIMGSEPSTPFAPCGHKVGRPNELEISSTARTMPFGTILNHHNSIIRMHSCEVGIHTVSILARKGAEWSGTPMIQEEGSKHGKP